MSASVATHADTGVATEAELAKRKRDVRGRSAGASPDAERMDEEAVASGDAHAKHLPGQHDQESHAGGARGAAARKAGAPGTYSAKAGEFTTDSGKKISVSQAAGFLYDMAMQGFGGSEAGEAGESESGPAGKEFFEDWSGDNASDYLAQHYRASSRVKEPSINADNPDWDRFAEDARDHVLSSDQYFTKSMLVLPLVEKFIRKRGSQWCVVSKKGKNLGCSDSKAGAAKRLAQVEYFKRHKSLAEDEIAARLDSGTLQVSDVVLKSWLNLEEKRVQFGSAVAKHFPSAPCPKCGSVAVDPHIGRGTHKCKECGHEYMPQEEKHLPDQHDQASHAGAGGAAGKVAHTPAQIRDAAARQHAKESGISITAAKKVVGSGAKVPTTKLNLTEAQKIDILTRHKEDVKFLMKVASGKVPGFTAVGINEAHRTLLNLGFSKEQIGKSLIAKAEQACLKSIWSQYYKYYSGKWIAAAWGLYQKGKFAQAAQAFAKARDGFQPDKNPKEFKCLDAWQQEAEGKGGEKSLVTKAEMAERQPLRFAAPMVNWDWVINKARTLPDGTMEWTATTTKFARDVQRDLVRRAFYEEAIRRFKSNAVPPPFVSVAHYRAAEHCLECGAVYKSLADYRCPQCKADRMLAGVGADIWIDGRQPKARGIFYPTEVGRAAFESIRQDIQKSLPEDERVRVSMGFYPDVPDGVVYTANGRDFTAGWIEHFALTRVPVVAETDITARMVHP